jgi:hypothetical protein
MDQSTAHIRSPFATTEREDGRVDKRDEGEDERLKTITTKGKSILYRQNFSS